MTQEPTDTIGSECPECKLPATIDPDAFLRFEITEQQATALLNETRHQYNDTENNTVSVVFEVDHAQLDEITNGLRQLLTNYPMVGVKQIRLAEQPDVAVTVLLDKDQVTDRIQENQNDLTATPNDDVYNQEFTVNLNTAIVFIRQVEAALDGAETPVEAIDMNAIRNSVSSP